MHQIVLIDVTDMGPLVGGGGPVVVGGGPVVVGGGPIVRGGGFRFGGPGFFGGSSGGRFGHFLGGRHYGGKNWYNY